MFKFLSPAPSDSECELRPNRAGRCRSGCRRSRGQTKRSFSWVPIHALGAGANRGVGTLALLPARRGCLVTPTLHPLPALTSAHGAAAPGTERGRGPEPAAGGARAHLRHGESWRAADPGPGRCFLRLPGDRRRLGRAGQRTAGGGARRQGRGGGGSQAGWHLREYRGPRAASATRLLPDLCAGVPGASLLGGPGSREMAGKRKKRGRPATQHRCNAKESQAFKPSLAVRHASPYGGVLHLALEPEKHETASGKLLVAWASGED